MTIKVGDMVKVAKRHRDLTYGKDYKVIELGYEGIIIKDDVGDRHFIESHEITPVTTTPTILTTITDRMEQHMRDGEYVRAVKWAQIAEMVKELEDG